MPDDEYSLTDKAEPLYFSESVMERNSTACAMEWSIELEKALRSKNPGRWAEAILQIGPRLEQWSGEPEATMSVYNMFGLTPGEDRLFANTIFLRLATAFQLGDKNIRISIVKVFLSLVRHCRDKKKSKRLKGVLSKSRVHNHVELLERVKIVFDSGDVESRALALVLFGCWADFAKDSAQIRYLVLSSLVSGDVLEVRASLFAAGCLSELADDFASVVLEMLVKIVTSSETESAVRLAAVRIFAKMGCSYSIANRAYKTGLKLVLDSSEEDFLVAMLVSLSKLAYKSTLLISEQVDFLLLILNRETTSRMQATALRCLHFIFVKGMCHSLVGESVIKTLFNVIDESLLPSTMQCEALQILRKILLCIIPNLPCANMPELADILTIVNKASQSPITSKSLLAIHVLVDVIKFQRRKETELGGVCTTLPLPSLVVSLIMDRITLLVKPLLDLCQFNSTVFKEVHSLLNLLLVLVGEHPELGVLVLDKVHLFIEHLVNTLDNVMDRQADSAVEDIVELRGERNEAISSKLVCIANRFIVSCLESLNEAGAITDQIFDKIKLMVECVCQCSLFDCYTHTIYSLLLDSQNIWYCMFNRISEASEVDRNTRIFSQNYSVEHETYAKRDKWPAYRAGVYAACQGAWMTATFMFRQLITEVQSDNTCCWLKSLSQFAHSEKMIQLLLLPKGPSSVNWLEKKGFPIALLKDDLCEVDQNANVISEPNNYQALVVAYRSLHSAGKTLEATLTPGKTFCFQRWFLALRAKVLGAVVDIFSVLSSIPPIHDNTSIGDGLKSLQQITAISFRLKRLSQEFDLIATSFIGMDRKSSNIIKSLALCCSILAVSAGIPLYIPSLAANETSTSCGLENSQNRSHAMLIQNLVGRLWNLDRETSTKLCMLVEVSEQSKNCFHLHSRNQILNIGCEVKDTTNVCRYAVSGIVGLQIEANKMQEEDIISQVTENGLQLISNIILKLMCIPFRAPKYFFKVRPCVGSELFVSNVDTRNLNVISVLTGFHLSLNLCFQLKNVPPDLPVRLTRFYCILCCSQKPVLNGQYKDCSSQVWENSDMVEMNEKLFQYVTACAQKNNYGKRIRDYDIDNGGGIVNAFVRFEPNERGQGFSNCLLDVSHFPAGSYRIKWHSCCVDSEGSYWSLLPLNAEPVFTVL